MMLLALASRPSLAFTHWATLPVTPLWQFWVSLTHRGENGVAALRSSKKQDKKKQLKKRKTSRKNHASNLECRHLSGGFPRLW